MTGTYDAVPYPSLAYPAASPNRLAAVARLQGVPAADPATCRYLDLGCGDGGNLLAVAAALAEASCLGLDASANAVARGTRLAQSTGLSRTELRHADLLALPDDLGEFDYVVAHGVLSWVDEPVREALFAGISRHLAPGGLALVSYHALPGFHLRAIARDVARRNAAGEPDPATRAALARKRLAQASVLHPKTDVYGHVLAAESARYAERDDHVLYHDELAAECTPFAVSDVAGRAGSHGLAYLGEALWEDMWAWRLGSVEAGRVRAAAGADPLTRQQLADDAGGAAFKATVFVHEGAAPDVAPPAEAALDLQVTPTLDSTPPVEPLTPAQKVATALAAAAPAAISVRELGTRAGLEEPVAAQAALRLAAQQQANLYFQAPPCAVNAGERPQTSALARAQAEAGAQFVASLRHEAIRLDDFARVLMRLLDGERDRVAIAAGLASAAREASASEQEVERVAGSLDAYLSELARLGLLKQ